jgi:hypothetical protein
MYMQHIEELERPQTHFNLRRNLVEHLWNEEPSQLMND